MLSILAWALLAVVILAAIFVRPRVIPPPGEDSMPESVPYPENEEHLHYPYFQGQQQASQAEYYSYLANMMGQMQSMNPPGMENQYQQGAPMSQNPLHNIFPWLWP